MYLDAILPVVVNFVNCEDGSSTGTVIVYTGYTVMNEEILFIINILYYLNIF